MSSPNAVAPGSAGTEDVALELRAVSKRYDTTWVLQDFSYTFRSGRVYGLIGVNGSGKSTLMKVIAGAERASGGDIVVDGLVQVPRNVNHAAQLGIGLVPQELPIAPGLSVAENIYLGALPTRFGMLRRRRLRQAALAYLADIGASLDVGRRAGQLSLGEQQLVVIARTLHRDASVVLLDEPTSALGARDVARLRGQVRAMAGQGCTVIIVSQRLDDVFAVSDDLLILRNGRLIASEGVDAFTVERAVELMLHGGSGAPDPPIPQTGPERPATPDGDHALEIDGLCSGATGPISLRVRSGEIVGLAGLPGSGTSNVLRALFGLAPATSTSLRLFGQTYSLSRPAASIGHGIAYVTGNRQLEGLVPESSIAVNIGMVRNRGLRGGPRRLRASREAACEQIAALRIRPPDPEARVGQLSGGNQQKVVFARWMLGGPRLWLLDDATRGVDIGARHDIHDSLRRCAADHGAATLIVSSDLLELFEVCDRIVVFRRGRVVADVPTAQTTPADIEAATIGPEGSGS